MHSSSTRRHFLTLLLLFLITLHSSLSFSFGQNLESISSPLAASDKYKDPKYHHPHHPHHQEQTFSVLNTTLGASSGREPLRTSNVVFNVDDFSAKADGGDNSKAFQKAWKKACSYSSRKSVDILVPRDREYHLRPITFSGPCKSRVNFKIYGTIKASPHMSDYSKDRTHWIMFENLRNFRVDGDGFGLIDGNGRKWWQNSCKVNKSLPCTAAPYAVVFYQCSKLVVTGLRFENAQKMHLTFQRCLHARAVNLMISAPEDSPNTDGIHVTETQDMFIDSCRISTGDDCISIVSGSRNVRISKITCGPGHGISIGSLGAGNSEARVSDVVVSTVNLIGSTNGLRIKTWQGGSGYAKDITFRNILMENVTNPIIIDQHYCDQKKPCREQASAVKVSRVVYQNVRGTSASRVAVKFDCSKRFGCQEVLVEDVNIVPLNEEEHAKALCRNVRLQHRGIVAPRCSSE